MLGVSWRVLTVVAMVGGLVMPTAAQGQEVTTAGSVSGMLQAVSCASGGQCWAVGSTSAAASTGSALIEQWNGSAWQVAPSQNPPGAKSSILNGVACAQVISCWAVGYYENAKGTATLPYAEHWNGQAWSEVAMPYPAGEKLKVNLMRAVSCPAAKLCFADGSSERHYEKKVAGKKVIFEYSASLIERWTGGSWNIVPSPAPPDSTVTDLQGLSCASTVDCSATGDWLLDTNPLKGPTRGGPLGYHWDGHQWAPASIQNVSASKAGDLYAVSCPALRMCMAIGARRAGPLARLWNGSSWAASSITVAAGGAVKGVFCATSQMCMAVGVTGAGTLVEQWNGSSWVTVPSPNPPGAKGDLFSTACLQATNCWAVGTWSNSPGTANVLIEHWNGTAWTVVAY
jgi:hypothetical protein